MLRYNFGKLSQRVLWGHMRGLLNLDFWIWGLIRGAFQKKEYVS